MTGETVPTLIQILDKQTTKFKSESTTKYEDKDFYDPATVLLLLDNSGSMSFDDKPLIRDSDGSYDDQVDAQPRINALIASPTKFMDELQALVGDQSRHKDKVLRTGMLAYNENIITARTIVPDWRTDPTKGAIGSMVVTGGTNSAPPLDKARLWMKGEDKKHTDMHGKDFLKFLIFMTDGVNSDDYGLTWVEEEDTVQ